MVDEPDDDLAELHAIEDGESFSSALEEGSSSTPQRRSSAYELLYFEPSQIVSLPYMVCSGCRSPVCGIDSIIRDPTLAHSTCGFKYIMEGALGDTHCYSFTNPQSDRFDIMLVRPMLVLHRRASWSLGDGDDDAVAASSRSYVQISRGAAVLDYSWFPGLAWRSAFCRTCGMHLGWAYYGRNEALVSASLAIVRFYGLIVTRLREDLVNRCDIPP